MDKPTYELIDGGIRCLICGLTSHNPNDVEQLYCGNCHVFHQKTLDEGPKFYRPYPD